MLSAQADVSDFAAEMERKCKTEINAFVHVRTMNILGVPADEIFVDLKPKLLSLAVGQFPVGEERQKSRRDLSTQSYKAVKTDLIINHLSLKLLMKSRLMAKHV